MSKQQPKTTMSNQIFHHDFILSLEYTEYLKGIAKKENLRVLAELKRIESEKPKK